MRGIQRVGVTPGQAQTQLELFTSWIDAAISGAVSTSLLPGEVANTDELIIALTEMLGATIAHSPSRDTRGVILARTTRRLRELAGGK